jgi:hypothetical protein
MKTSKLFSAVLFIGLLVMGCKQAPPPAPEAPALEASTPDAKLVATIYNSGFEHSHDTYNGLSALSDGKVYYVLCSELMDLAGQMYCLDPATQKIEHMGDLTEMVGEKDMKVVAQGKSHVRFYEYGGKYYFSTHLGYYSIIDGMEMPGIPKGDYKKYRGGHLVSFDPKTKKGESICLAPNGEGILTTTMDTQRGIIYAITWPTGGFFRYDVGKKELKDFGPYSGKAESKGGDSYRVICRSIAINPNDGTAYFTNAEGDILKLKVGSDIIEKVAGDNMKKDYFGKYEVSTAGSMAYNWRQVFWYAPENKFYGVHGNSGYLFSFDPAAERVEVLERLTSIPSKKSGVFDQFSFGYLGFDLGPDGRTIYYLTGGPIYVDGKRVTGEDAISRGAARGLENLHVITYDIPTNHYVDHGTVFYPDGQRPLYVNSIAIGKDGTVYGMGRVERDGKVVADLFAIPNPLNK